MKTAAREVGRFNVRVNALLPGFHATDIAAQMTEAEKDRLESGRVLPTAVRPQDVSAMAMALCENESMSGQVVSCDSRIL